MRVRSHYRADGPQGIDDTLDVKRHEAVLILGASGAIGMLAVQFAKLQGTRVLAAASGEDGKALVRKFGADVAIDGRREDIADAARHFAPNGLDAVLALVGGEPLEHALAALRRGGRVAYPDGAEPEPR
jgi:NADPH:quinone reductase